MGRPGQATAPADDRTVARCAAAAVLVTTATLLWFLTRDHRALWLGLVLVGLALAWSTVRAFPAAGPTAPDTALNVIRLCVLTGVVANLGSVLATGATPSRTGSVVLGACLVLLALVADGRGGPSAGRWTAVAVVTLTAAYGVWLLGSSPAIDVREQLVLSVDHFLAGGNPYAMTFPSTYDEAQANALNGPGMLVEGRVPFGLPYPPPALLLATLGHLLGDVRLGGLLALGAAALLVHGRGDEPHRRLLALLLVALPGASWIVLYGWTETLPLALLAACLTLLRAGSPTALGLCVGAFFVSKQYLVVGLPLLWLLRPWLTPRALGAVGTAAAMLTLPWLLADPASFVRSLVTYQLAAAPRADSMSGLVAATEWLGLDRVPHMGLLALGLGLVVSAAGARWAPKGGAPFCLWLGLAVATTMLAAERSFFNYWFLVAGTFVLMGSAGSRTPAKAMGARRAGPRRTACSRLPGGEP